MKKTLIFSTLMVLLSFNAKAAEIKQGALYCINAKKIIAYYDYKENGNDKYAKKLMDRADCFIKGRNEEGILRKQQKKYIELELLSGFKIWTKEENIIR